MKNIKEIIKNKKLFLDIILTASFCLVLLSTFFYSELNVTFDDYKYYSNLAHFTNSKPIYEDSFYNSNDIFPGYSAISIPAFYLVNFVSSFFEEDIIYYDREEVWEGYVSYPTERISAKDSLFKVFVENETKSYFDTKIAFSMILTSYIFLFIGILFCIKTLYLINKNFFGYFIIPLTLILSPIFMKNLVFSPLYPVAITFGFSAIFTYFFIRSMKEKNNISKNLKFYENPQIISGALLGTLSLIRLEGFVIFIVIISYLYFSKRVDFFNKFLNSYIIIIGLILLYNNLIFKNPFFFGFLKIQSNFFGFDLGYIFLNLFHPESGILFWSTIIVIGLISLIFSKKDYSKVLLYSSLILIFFFVIRITWLACPNEFLTITKGTSICSDAFNLIRADVNRYIVILIPFSFIGINNLIEILKMNITRKKYENKRN